MLERFLRAACREQRLGQRSPGLAAHLGIKGGGGELLLELDDGDLSHAFVQRLACLLQRQGGCRQRGKEQTGQPEAASEVKRVKRHEAKLYIFQFLQKMNRIWSVVSGKT